MKYVIGVVGENGAGKGTFSSLLTELAAPRKVKVVRFSNVLYKTLLLWDLPATRANLQNLAITMNSMFGDGTLTNAVKKLVTHQKGEIIILEGVRWLSDVPMVRSFPNSHLVYITASPRVRFKRMKERHEKIGEDTKTYKQFLKEEKAKTEKEIKKIGNSADFTFVNNGDLKNLKKQIREFYNKFL